MSDNGQQKKSYLKVIEYIKGQIISGRLAAGTRLPPERELSAALGISRNSVREAIRMLDIMGIISCQQGAGNFLTGSMENNLAESLSMMFLLNKIDYSQISQIRRGLELQALILAIDKISEAEIAGLKEIISQLEHGTEENNITLDKQLHYNIALASGNTMIIDILSALSEVIDQFIADLRRDILSSERNRERLLEAHTGMVASLVNRDKRLAYEAVDKHFNVIDERLSYINS